MNRRAARLRDAGSIVIESRIRKRGLADGEVVRPARRVRGRRPVVAARQTESVSWPTDRVGAERLPWRFVQSARAFELAGRAPAGVSVAAAIDALKAVTRTESGAVP
ncbi:hypothetical protein [Burkholderia sp. Se-20373]|uniref:hypothetical protein n=1 Tax=Burkholderia sp. Se-20373 TaxID=2703898 RepID=UPI001F11E82B|nr:hypothetical protein [Burkholderia sp. Se-20373]